MKKCCMVLTATLVACSVSGMDGVEWLKNHDWFDVVSVTSTDLTLKVKNGSLTITQDDSYRKYTESVKTNAWATPWRKSSDYIANDEALILTPDQETRFSLEMCAVTLSPASFKNKQKGFRVKKRIYGHSDGKSIHTAYIALSDTPVEMGEDDVEMVMDDGKWVTAEEARKRLEVEELGPRALRLFQMVNEIKRDSKLMAEVLENPFLLADWNMLIENGYIKTNAVDTASSASERSNPNSLWLYAGILLCILCPILYFLRRKLKT